MYIFIFVNKKVKRGRILYFLQSLREISQSREISREEKNIEKDEKIWNFIIGFYRTENV